ncbi:hypothetical protein PR202_gb26836 [Eleusine coracana subsp. coracana]|uniref:Disease resistance N-terminal domain-containing protein n=1 Tax=Eleusine coracana subsp. coracana TaxID=191504 RepID=A0AAV5FPX7_ELECO|nr:hypothetical protein PR202_gb26836 [Eleusine coracana subsp. coracana]
MNAVISAVVSDFINRFISFLIEKYHRQQAHQVVTDDSKKIVSRIQRLLLRAGTVVEEAEGRRITNHSLLLQLKQLREAVYRGYYCTHTFDNHNRKAASPLYRTRAGSVNEQAKQRRQSLPNPLQITLTPKPLPASCPSQSHRKTSPAPLATSVLGVPGPLVRSNPTICRPPKPGAAAHQEASAEPC